MKKKSMLKHKNKINIIIMESSQIICEGLRHILYQSELDCFVTRIETLDDFLEMLNSHPVDILIANPMQFVNREKDIKKLRRSHPHLAIIGIDFGVMKKKLFHLMDAYFSIYDSVQQILEEIEKIEERALSDNNIFPDDDNLTDREIDVLIKLVNGNSNKEIADTLNISIHTVTTHRKNIAVKTGIKSLSGLTIYAISKKIVSIEDLKF
ncbi:MAG TPA: hypothetical protein DDZ96_10370 [Porphyromonadaceae bacterium]|nr:hypothetical protein [Porphyromonadaceae bacterium]